MMKTRAAVAWEAGKPLEIEMLDLAHERDGIARLLAPETVVKTFFAVNGERPRLLVVERAQPRPPTTDALELGVLGHKLHDVRRLTDSLYVLVDDPHASESSGRGCRLFRREPGAAPALER